jgi:hypothetical protein
MSLPLQKLALPYHLHDHVKYENSFKSYREERNTEIWAYFPANKKRKLEINQSNGEAASQGGSISTSPLL